MVLRPTRPADWHGVPTCSTLYLGILWMKCLPVVVVRIWGFSEWGEQLGPSLITCSRSPCDIAGNKRHKTVTVLVWSFYKGIFTTYDSHMYYIAFHMCIKSYIWASYTADHWCLFLRSHMKQIIWSICDSHTCMWFICGKVACIVYTSFKNNMDYSLCHSVSLIVVGLSPLPIEF